VLERLGIGGMATVHRAIERGAEGFERVVALKRLLPHLAEDEEFVRAFVREAKLASMLRHISIVQIYELGRVGPSYFISMEYIPGRDLRVILRQARRVCGPPPIEVALALLNELLEALDYAHSQRAADGTPLGIVHRDISPSNLLVSHTGHLKVIDFGIAKATIGHLMTHTGRVKGKLSYMAPEALSGRLDGRSDLFSASVIAHELLTATPLFACKEDLQTIDKLQNMQPPPPSTKNPTCPPELDEIVLRGLAKDPATRWQSATEMRGAIMELASGRYRLASKREVCHWVEEAFEMQAPSRRRMPLAAPTPDVRRNGATASESEDEIMELVWGPNGPSAQHPVVLDEVPDVSGRISAVISMPRPGYGTEPNHEVIVEEEPTNDMLRPLELGPPAGPGSASAPARHARRSQSQIVPLPPPASDIFSLGGTPAAVSWPPGSERPTTRPPEWAFGTSGTTGRHAFGGTSSTTGPQAPSGVLDAAIADAQRAMGGMPGTASPATPRRRAPLLPVLAAAVAVAGAGAAIAWIVTARREGPAPRAAAQAQQKVVAAAEPPPPAVRELPPEPQAAEPRHEAVDPPPASGGVAGAAATGAPATDIGRAAEPARPIDKPGKGARADRADRAAEKTNEVTADAADHEPRARRPVKRSKRDIAEERHAARARDDADVEDAKDEPADRASDDDERATPSARSTTSGQRAAAEPPASKATRATEDTDLEPLPVPVPVPDQAPKPRKPVIITPDRAVRESGEVPRLRFPPWEQAPAAVAYKLCIDPNGAVASVTVLSKLSTTVRSAVVDGLRRWRYKPVVQAGQKVSACFATTFKTELK
jgi:eukaryotic-like serine/threonine-protein kinase